MRGERGRRKKEKIVAMEEDGKSGGERREGVAAVPCGR